MAGIFTKRIWQPYAGRGADYPRGKLNVKIGLPLNLYFDFSMLLVFSRLLFLCFSDYFPWI